jgi:hypothetical protein
MAPRGKKQVTLTQALSQFLGKTLVPDLKVRAAERSVEGALRRQWQAEKDGKRTADSFIEWRDRALEQIGAAWVLGCVFVRTLEDRELLARRRLAGPGAGDSEQLFFEVAPSLTARDYLLTVFREVASLPGAEGLLGPRHNPLWRLGPSADVARALLAFFRQEDDAGALVWRFEGTNTRFLGDLYQDLSEDVRKRYALLQTPEFVERFILGETLDPAIAEFGLETVRVIDPTCGSGHFLLGAFDRLLTLRLQAAPGVDVRDQATAALAQVYGVDVNPYAVAIARFRLTLAYLQRTGITKLAQAPRLPLNLVVADSLLHGAKSASLLFAEHELAEENYAAWGAEMFALDEPQAARKVFGQRYHAVVGNPPYITPKDKALRDGYREFYQSCYREYALSAPFTERFFQLAVEGGFVGLINANSFMKREFGRALIEKVLPHIELTYVVDTSGAYIPGHGTPTVIVFGRNRKAVGTHVLAVLGKRGEPSTPGDAEQGLVWRSIAERGREVGFENDFLSVAGVAREVFAKHPWSLGGGGAADLKALLEGRAESTLGNLVESIGFGCMTRADELYFAPRHALINAGIADDHIIANVEGEVVRDWSITAPSMCLFPYDRRTLDPVSPQASSAVHRFLWPHRTALWLRREPNGNHRDIGLTWWEWSRFQRERFRTPFSIAFAFVATHNHFVLDRGGKVFKQTAPIIKLPESATEDDHLALLAYLNSSTACFWMKHVVMNKGATSDKGVLQSDPEKFRFEFDGTKLKALPVPSNLQLFRNGLLLRLARALDLLAQENSDDRLSALIADAPAGDLEHTLSHEFEARETRRRMMVALQEELDWAVYELMGLVPASSSLRACEPEQLAGMDADARPYRQKLSNLPRSAPPKEVALIEGPEFKRRWFRSGGKFDGDNVTDADVARSAVEVLLLDMAERGAAASIVVLSQRQLVAQLLSDEKAAALASYLWREANAADRVADLASSEMIPAFKACVLTEQGLEKHATWRHTWNLQRREDLGESVGDIPVPPKYDQKDFRDPAYWRLRGKLDVPKERFISYPGCQKDNDPSPLIGWAGWNHLRRAQALVALYQERKTEDAWPKERLIPMLVGLHELMFWLDMWHSQPEAGSQNPAREFKQFLDAELHAHALTTDDLEAWRPEKSPKATGPRKRRGKNAAPETGPDDEAGT